MQLTTMSHRWWLSASHRPSNPNMFSNALPEGRYQKRRNKYLELPLNERSTKTSYFSLYRWPNVRSCTAGLWRLCCMQQLPLPFPMKFPRQNESKHCDATGHATTKSARNKSFFLHPLVLWRRFLNDHNFLERHFYHQRFSTVFLSFQSLHI